MRIALRIIVLCFSFGADGFAQQSDVQMKMDQPAEKPVALLSGLGSLQHPTSTKNPEGKVLPIAENLLAARIAEAKHDNKMALEFFNKAVAAEDALAYDEPPQWFHPVRESLGGFLLRSGNYAEAEKVFRADLDRNKNGGRSLFGLMEGLKAQKKAEAAKAVQREFENAWKNADTKLSIADL